MPALRASLVALLLLAPTSGLCLARPAPPPPRKKPNVLFIAVDDLNHWVGHLGRNKQTKTPNIDRLAARGVTFRHAYCSAPACNPSRTSLMCGLRPSTSGVYHNPDNPWPLVGKVVTLNERFRKAGYYVAAAGKIYHGAFQRKGDWDDFFAGGGGKKANAVSGGVGGIRFAPQKCADSDLADYR